MGGKKRRAVKTPTRETPIDRLSADHVSEQPIAVNGWCGDGDAHEEWSDAVEDEETFYEAQRCEACREILTFAGGYSGGKHKDAAYDAIGIDDPEEVTCEGYVGACEGPMMNYAYPCAWQDGHDTARALVDLPLVPVVLRNGEHALALTGGGMDLRWEICHAYVVLGFLPPLAHCDLPRYGNTPMEGEWRALVVDACERTATVAESWAKRTREQMSEARGWLRVTFDARKGR